MIPQFSVRRARLSDLDRVMEIEHAGFGQWAWDRNLFAEHIRKCGDTFLVVLWQSRVIGYCITWIFAGLIRRRAELVSIAVDPALRGKGAADALMIAALRALRRRGIPRLKLMVKVTNERARAFYEKYGFQQVRRVPHYYEDGEDGFLFRLDL
jgi:ribosomal-protein-alanine N-acetyltransferase